MQTYMVFILPGSNIIVIKPGEDLNNVYKYIYRYPQFEYGKVYFINGDASAGKLNYNFLIQTMQFIDPKGDTLALANESALNFISIGADTFFHNNKGYIEQVADYTFTKLLLKEKLQSSEEKIGAFGIPSSTQTIDTKNTLIADQNYKLRVNGNLILSKEKHYYFSDSDFNILPVNNKNLMKVFAKQKGKIENYIKSNNTDLNNENDLKNFFTYLKSVF
ncbi:MAG: hypothetical protein H0V14_02450 [Chitinophagaceae bacterium]|nr:hypothetical protein [Chitinophagaceae bacterium]